MVSAHREPGRGNALGSKGGVGRMVSKLPQRRRRNAERGSAGNGLTSRRNPRYQQVGGAVNSVWSERMLAAPFNEVTGGMCYGKGGWVMP